MLLLLISVSIFSYGQDSTFTFTKSGFTDFVVSKVDGKSQADLYKKALDWISVTYKNPNEVIKAKIENDYIRFEGSNRSMICVKSLGMMQCDLATYQVEISFKEGKYKFDVIEVRVYTRPSQYASGGWSAIVLPTQKQVDEKPESMNGYFNDEGEPRRLMRFYVENIPKEFNALNQSLREFLSSDKIPSQQKDW